MKERLDSVLRIRQAKERQRLGELGKVERELDAAQREAERRRRERFAWAVPSGLPLDRAGLRGVQIQALALHDAEAAALADAAAVRHRRDRARERWSQARIELRSVERLAEHRDAVRAADAAARAQAAADELALLTRGRQ